MPGYFWLPADPGRRIPGVVRHTLGERLELELFGTLRDDSDGCALETPPVIHGVTTSGTRCTLLETFGTYWKAGHRAGEEVPAHEGISAGITLLGSHINVPENARFAQSTGSFSHLGTWVQHPPFTHTITHEGGVVRTLAATQPPGFLAVLPEHGITIRLGGHLHLPWRHGYSVHWDYTPYFTITAAPPVTLDRHLMLLRSLRAFLALCTHRPVRTEVTRISQEAGEIGADVLQATWQTRSPGRLHPAEVLVPFPAIREQITTILNAWVHLYARAQEAIDLCTAVVYGAVPLSTLQVTALVQATEAYHRATHLTPDPRAADYRPHYDRIIASLPPDIPPSVRKRVTDQLGDPQPSLAVRLGALFEELGQLAVSIATDRTLAVAKIVRARNRAAHSASDIGAESGKWGASHLRRILQQLLLAHILRDLSISDEVIREALRRFPPTTREPE